MMRSLPSTSRFWLIAAAVVILVTPANSQDLLNKLKKKAAEKAAEVIGVKAPQGQGSTQPSGSGSTNSTENNPVNKGRGGLVTTPPDVRANLSDASAALQAKKYSEARYAVQQAMLGVEMEIGNKVLKSLPATISGLKKSEDRDRVTSNGFGWAGLTIERVYSDGNDKQLELTIANNAAWMTAVNMYLTNGGYAQSTGGQQNMKQTKVRGMRAVIEYDAESGYKLSIPLGQTSLAVFEAVNFSSEQEVMAAAVAVDLEGIRKMLGEQ